MKHITILEVDSNYDSSNVGTISSKDLELSFKKAVESHFDAELLSVKYLDNEIDSLDDCVNAYPIEVLVNILNDGIKEEVKVSLSETWLY